MFCLPLIKVVQHMNHGSVADELSLGGKIPANSNSVFTSRQSPFSAPAIARSAFCNSLCWVAEGREEEGILGAGGGWVAGAGAFGCGSGGVGAAQDSLAGEGGLARSDLLSGKDPLADEGVRPTSGSFVGEGSAGEDARPPPALASLKSAGDQASSPMILSGTRNRSTVTLR